MENPLGALKNLACLIPVILISLTLHEWGHAFAAHKCGDDTARNLGRMTLNPIPHIDPLGFLSLLIFGLGWAKPVPVNPRNYRNYKRGEAIVSLAGVFMNFLLAILFTALTVLFGWMSKHVHFRWLNYNIISTILQYGLSCNLVLMFFNLLPIYPLDGYHIFELIFAKVLPIKLLDFLRRYGRFILIGIVLIMNYTHLHPAGALYDWISDQLSQLILKL